jgi:hypothetical protein
VSQKTPVGLALLLVKNYNNELSTTERFWEGKFMGNDILGRDNNNEEKSYVEIGGKIENKKRKIEDEERMGKIGKMRYNDNKINYRNKAFNFLRVVEFKGCGISDKENWKEMLEEESKRRTAVMMII